MHSGKTEDLSAGMHVFVSGSWEPESELCLFTADSRVPETRQYHYPTKKIVQLAEYKVGSENTFSSTQKKRTSLLTYSWLT